MGRRSALVHGNQLYAVEWYRAIPSGGMLDQTLRQPCISEASGYVNLGRRIDLLIWPHLIGLCESPFREHPRADDALPYQFRNLGFGEPQMP